MSCHHPTRKEHCGSGAERLKEGSWIQDNFLGSTFFKEHTTRTEDRHFYHYTTTDVSITPITHTRLPNKHARHESPTTGRHSPLKQLSPRQHGSARGAPAELRGDIWATRKRAGDRGMSMRLLFQEHFSYRIQSPADFAPSLSFGSPLTLPNRSATLELMETAATCTQTTRSTSSPTFPPSN